MNANKVFKPESTGDNGKERWQKENACKVQPAVVECMVHEKEAAKTGPAAAQEELVWEGAEHYSLSDGKLLKDFKLEQNVIY